MVSPQSTLVQLPLFAIDKRCTRCDTIKPLDAFHRHSKGKNGRVAWCKTCVRAYDKQHREQNRERLRAADRDRHTARTGEDYARYIAYHRAYYQAHRGRILAQKKVYHEANKERDNNQRRMWHHANKERAQALNRAWHAAHPDYRETYNKDYYQRTRPRRIAYRRAYYAANTPSCRASIKAWQVKNRERYSLGRRMRKHDRRARELEAEGSWTRSDVQAIYEAQRGRCAYCLVDLGGGYSIEHMTPISKGGSNWPWNLCVACPPCNSAKRDTCAGSYLARLLKKGRRAKALLPTDSGT